MKLSQPIHRILGAVFLAIAAIQVAVGLTLLHDRLGHLATLMYWSACLLATLGAILCAFVDALRNLGESRRERRQLLEQTLREIDAERGRHQSARNEPTTESH